MSAELTAGRSMANPDEVEGAIAEFVQVLDDLRGAHAELTARAARMERELCDANSALASQLAELEAILHDLPTGVIVRAIDGAVVRANPAAQQLIGADELQLCGRTELGTVDALPPDGTPSPWGDGERVVARRRSPVTLPDGTPTGTVELLDDRTELESMTRRVHQQSKMVALGTMAGGIAHEVRNPLNAVRGFASLLGDRLEGDDRAARWASLIQEGADECDAIIGAVLAFAAPERLTIERLDIAELVGAALDTVRRELVREERLDAYQLASDVPDGLVADGDRIQLRQALRNLIANAVDAQPDGGAVQVEARVEDESLVLRVHDAGPGIPPDVAGRVAEPFFTTRADGTGLGLALVHTVARLHDGRLDVGTAPGPLGGADLALTIPVRGFVPGSSLSPASPLVPAPNRAR